MRGFLKNHSIRVLRGGLGHAPQGVSIPSSRGRSTLVPPLGAPAANRQRSEAHGETPLKRFVAILADCGPTT